MSIKFLFSLHNAPPICIRRQKNPCDFGCLYRLVLRTDFNPDYLIFSRFHLKNRTTTKPTSKSLFFNDFNARRGIATLNSNSMVSDGNYSVRIRKRERTIGQLLYARYNERLNDIKRLTLVFSIIPEIKPVVKQTRTNVLVFIFAKAIVSS
mgnify:CR=1